MENAPNRERDRTWLVREPLLCFVVDSVRYALSVTQKDTGQQMTWEEGRELVLKSLPDAEIILEDEQQAT